MEKSSDEEAPLLASYDGVEFASSDRPSKLLNGRASFKLKISQVEMTFELLECLIFIRSNLRVFPFGLPLKVFKTCLLGRSFHTLIKNFSFSSPINVGSHNPTPAGPNVLANTRSLFQLMWDSPVHPPSGFNVLTGTPSRVHLFRGLASSLTHCPVSGSDTICMSLSPPLADIVLFGLFFSGFHSRFLKCIY